MALGEKLFEDRSKTTSNTIKSVGPEGVTIELNWIGDIKGQGRLAGVDGKNMASGTYVQGPSGIAKGHAQGILQTNQGEAVVWQMDGTGKTTGEFVGILTFMTTSTKLGWLNGVIAFYEGRGPPGFQEWSGIAQEWK